MHFKNVLEKILPGRSLKKLINWAHANSLQFITVSDGCFDGQRLVRKLPLPGEVCSSKHLQKISPHHADVLVVTGCFSHQGATNLKYFFQKMCTPRWVVAAGNCSISGGMFNTYSCQQGIDELLPVDVYIRGCPPTEQALKSGLTSLRNKIKFNDLNISSQQKNNGEKNHDTGN